KYRALKIAEEYEAVSRGRKNVSQVQRALADLMEEINEDTRLRVSTEDAVQEFIDRKEGNIGHQTFAKYKIATRMFKTFLSEARVKRPLVELTKEDILDFMNWRRTTHGASNNTINTDLKCLRTFLRHTVDAKY